MACSLASLYHKNFIDHQSPSWHCDAAFILFFIFFLKQLQIILPALIAQHGTRFFSRTGHFRGCWRSFSPLGKQSTLRTDSFSAPAPTITPAPTTEDFHPPPPSAQFASSPTFSHFFLSLYNIDPHPEEEKEEEKITSFQHTLPPYLSVYRTLSARFLCQTPPVSPPFFSFLFALL